MEAAVVGHGIAALAAEAATKKVAKVYAVEHELLEQRTVVPQTGVLVLAQAAAASATASAVALAVCFL